MDYVTCGTGSYFDFFSLIPTSLYPARLGEPSPRPSRRSPATPSSRPRATSARRMRPRRCWPPATPTWSRSSGARSPIPTWWPRRGAGRADRVRPCISCNQLCWGRRSRDYWISCLINPSAGREHVWGGDRFEPAAAPARCSSSAVGRPGSRRPGWRRNGATPSPWCEAASAWAGSGGWPGASRPAVADPRSPGLVRAGAGRLGVDVRLGHGVDAGLVAEAGAGRGRRRHGRGDRPVRASSAPCRWSTACPASTSQRRQHPRRPGRHGGRRRAVSSCSTTSATGGASARPCSSRRPACTSRW